MSNRVNTLPEYFQQYELSVKDPEGFWAEKASYFTWKQKWDKVLDGGFDNVDMKWFVNGKLNITENCLDRHLATRGDQIAYIWEPNDEVKDKVVTLTYKQLHAEVCKFANVLKSHGVKKGDRVCLYMPMILELAVATLACARIGAVHSVVFAGFSASALADRINDAKAKVIVTTDGSVRGPKNIGIKNIVDDAVEKCAVVEKVIVYKRTGDPVNFTAKDVWWHDEMAKASDVCEAVAVDSEDPLFILYTSGSTGQPKGVVHATGGYMVYADYSFRNVFQYNDGDTYMCTADIGWITGHSYIVYGPLLSGATSVLFEGVPTYPDAGRFWKVVDKHKVTHFYTAPTAIRSLMGAGLEFVNPYKLDTLKVLGSVGEPINEEAWHWHYDHIGKKKCPIVDTWWQTETGGIMISPLAAITPSKPTYATLPLPGIQPVLVDADGKVLEGNGVEGNLCIKFPWPSVIRTTYGDHERCKQTYFSTYKGLYFTGDGARRDEDGYYRILGRVDDVINVSGHRMGTAEVENAINEHDEVIESAIVGYPHEIKGQGIYAFVIVEKTDKDDATLRNEILAVVTKIIGPIAKPDKIQIVRGLPKTRSGKIMRRILRKVAEGDVSNLGDTSTLLDPTVVDDIIAGAQVAIKA